jgi:glycosyltransferase involved in cell wall biosynthesis
MRICIIGKFPPIQGGVSMRTYWSAQGLGALGHEVHVVTNARETAAPHRMLMRGEDWDWCAREYDTGSVTVHWTDPVGRSQSYIPMASPFVSKLAGLAASLHSERPFDVIYSHYLEPYGVAGLLASQMCRTPHVVRMAGSDAGRLWQHPQLELLYDHVLRSAEAVVAEGTVAERAIQRGVSPSRIVRGGGFVVPEDLFTPEGSKLDIARLRADAEADPSFSELIWGGFLPDRPVFGVYGKLGERKGSFALLSALHRLTSAGLDVGLVALAHGNATMQRDFRARVIELGLADRVLQIPFLPHWRVPEFLRSCLAVCCLEQGFPIEFHTPLIPREVLLCGACLVGSTEVIRKLSSRERLPYGYGCIAIEDVNDTEVLSERLAAIVRVPRLAAAIGARGREFALEIQRNIPFLQMLQSTLETAGSRRTMPASAPATVRGDTADSADSCFRLTQLAVEAAGGSIADRYLDEAGILRGQTLDQVSAERALASLERGVSDGDASLQPFAAAARIEVTIKAAERDSAHDSQVRKCAPCLQLSSERSAEDSFACLVPVRDPQLRIVEFGVDVSVFLGVQTVADFPSAATPGPSYVVVFAASHGKQKYPLVVDGTTARILILSDGTRTAGELIAELTRTAEAPNRATHLEWLENLFAWGLIRLHDNLDD